MIIRPYAFFGEPGNNPGDLLVEMGARALELPFEDTFLIGTPWIYDQCQTSYKYQWLTEQKPQGRFIALGIGSSFPLGWTAETHIKSLPKDQRDFLKGIWGQFDIIAVRDTVAQDWLRMLDIQSHIIPCPSVLTSVGDGPYRPGSKIFVGNFDKTEMANDAVYLEYQRGAYTEGDVESLFRFIGSHETIISDRVHSVVPFANKRRCAIVPVDSRHQTATVLGIQIYPKCSDLKQTRFVETRKRYQDLIRQ